ncbi:restriction endonuclease subunit S [Rhodohalobacter sp. 614A]|uniref:restriction endonuclease subunit S n=1 Tax=Rhodohalobacter sp. 614A TaxID=2908649 RepID=UPI001F3C09D5|nr:restriction endonuclease subunit S [Rhodohalobacter sp. 614A]
MKLEEITELIVDSEHKTAPTEDEGYPYIRTPNIGRGRLILDDVRRISQESYEKWTRRAVPQKNDLILAREAPVGNVAIVTDGLKPCLGQRTVLIRPDEDKIYPQYLVYLLLGDEIQERFHAVSTGSTVPHLNMSDIRGLELSDLPSYETQQKIASILSAFDDLIENNTRRIAILEEMAQLIYREWFVHYRYPGHEKDELVDSGVELGDVPKEWDIKSFSEIAEFQNGKAFKPKHWQDEGLPIVKIRELKSGFSDNTSYYHGRDIDKKYYINDGDLLFAWSASLGIFLWYRGKALLNQHIFNVSPKVSYLTKDYLYYALDVSLKEFLTKTAGTTMQHIRKSALDEVHIALPPQDVYRHFDSAISPINRQILLLHKNLQRLKETRDLLLPKLISGKIDTKQL